MEDYDETRAATDTGDAQHRRDDIDGLRCLAVAAVVAFHAVDGYDAGFCGVDVFFAISGFVVAASLKRRERTSTKTFLVEFYARRAKRLAPALFLTILATAVGLRLVPLHERDARISYDAALCALGGASNIFFAVLFTSEKQREARSSTTEPAGYFASWTRTEEDVFLHDAEADPFLHTWSLGVEEQFYLILPCLFLLAHSERILNDNVAVSIALVSCLLSLVCGIVLHVIGEADYAFYLLPSRLWELAAGWLVCELNRDVPERHALKIDLLGAALLACALAVSKPHQYPLPGALPAILGTCCILMNPHGKLNALLAKKPFPAIGRASYGLYLFHWPLLVLLRLGLAHQILATCIALVISLPLTYASFQYVETPARKWAPKRRAAPLFATLFSFGACAIAVSQLRPGDRSSGTSSGYSTEESVPGPPFFGAEFDANAWERINTNVTCGAEAYYASCNVMDRGVPCACATNCTATTHLPQKAGQGTIPCMRTAVPQCQGWYSTNFDAGSWPFGVWRSECFFLSSAVRGSRAVNLMRPSWVAAMA